MHCAAYITKPYPHLSFELEKSQMAEALHYETNVAQQCHPVAEVFYNNTTSEIKVHPHA